MSRIVVPLLFLLSVLSSSTLLAAAPNEADCARLPDATQRLSCYDGIYCARIADRTERLLCYDRTVGDSSAAPIDVEQLPQRPAATAERPTVSRRSEPVPAPATQQTPTAEQRTPEDLFGSEDLVTEETRRDRSERKRRQAKQVDSVITDIVTLFPSNERVYTLANGQRWEQTRASNATIRDGDAVTITRSRIGSYFLKSERGASVRVERVE